MLNDSSTGLPTSFRLTARRLAVLAAAFFAVVTVTGGSGAAHGLIDQQNSSSTQAMSCGAPLAEGASLFQGFTPTRGGLSGIDLSLQVGGSFPSAGREVRVLIRAGSPTGPLMADQSVFVAGPQNSGSLDIHVDFARPVPVRPGMLHYLQWFEAGPAAELSWKGSPSDPYAAGDLYSACVGAGSPPAPFGGGGHDAMFTTYFGGAPTR